MSGAGASSFVHATRSEHCDNLLGPEHSGLNAPTSRHWPPRWRPVPAGRRTSVGSAVSSRKNRGEWSATDETQIEHRSELSLPSVFHPCFIRGENSLVFIPSVSFSGSVRTRLTGDGP